MNAGHSRAKALFVAGLSFGVIAAAVMSWRYAPPIQWVPLATLAVLSLASEWMAFDVPIMGTVSLSYVVTYAAVLLGGPLLGAGVALAGSVPPQDIRARKPIHIMVFNAAQMAAAGLSAGWAYLALGGMPLTGLGQHPPLLSLAPGAAAAAVTIFLVNSALVAAIVSLTTGVPVRTVWAQSLAPYTVNFAALAVLGFVMALVVVVVGIPGALFLGLPLIAARQTFRSYLQLTEAYADTVLSLVTAVEAKDPYTRGHSERVARYARRLAEGEGLSIARIRRVELAAMLHDIGKIGIPSSILSKPGRLTDDEYDAVKQHPENGVALLDGVEHLEDLLGAIMCHHERIDGGGYPLRLAGDAIPYEARLLAVADCFDAMTSNRAYRKALSYMEAIEELRRVSGLQVDAGLVERFISAVDEWQAEGVLGEYCDRSGDSAPLEVGDIP
jgi:hypothetical protein